MDVSYRTTVDDFVAFDLRMWRKSKVAREAYLVGWLLVSVFGLLGAAAVVAFDGPSFVVVAFVVGAGAPVRLPPGSHGGSSAAAAGEA